MPSVLAMSGDFHIYVIVMVVVPFLFRTLLCSSSLVFHCSTWSLLLVSSPAAVHSPAGTSLRYLKVESYGCIFFIRCVNCVCECVCDCDCVCDCVCVCDCDCAVSDSF